MADLYLGIEKTILMKDNRDCDILHWKSSQQGNIKEITLNDLHQYKFIVIDGNIGSGKSTIFEMMQSLIKKYNCFPFCNKPICFIKEPVEEWLVSPSCSDTETENKSIFELFNENHEKYAFLFQIKVFTSRINAILKGIETFKKENGLNPFYVVCDRSLIGDKIFFDIQNASYIEKDIYQGIHEIMCKNIIDRYCLMIYVNTDYKECEKRIKNRKRSSESKITQKYLLSIQNGHTTMIAETFKPNPIYTKCGFINCTWPDALTDQKKDARIYALLYHIDRNFSV
jgi:deoxyadenosine/deoxycytidine kinase